MKKLAFAVTAASGAAAALSHHDAEASTQHKVQSGESLWTIAQKYNTSVDSIKQNNNLDNNIISNFLLSYAGMVRILNNDSAYSGMEFT